MYLVYFASLVALFALDERGSVVSCGQVRGEVLKNVGAGEVPENSHRFVA